MYFLPKTYQILWSTVLQREQDFVPGYSELLKNIKVQALWKKTDAFTYPLYLRAVENMMQNTDRSLIAY